MIAHRALFTTNCKQYMQTLKNGYKTQYRLTNLLKMYKNPSSVRLFNAGFQLKLAN